MKTKLLIIGGGCAGLSLGSRLAQSSSQFESLIIEPRTRYENDRTWCFWKGQGSGQEHLPLCEWGTIEVSRPGEKVLANYSDQPYQMLRSIDFYHDKLDLINSSHNVELRCGVTALSCRKAADGSWKTETLDATITSDYIIDTRPLVASMSEPPVLWQTFVGYEVECEYDSFEPATAHLMEFVESDSNEIAFLYILPTDSKRALIELTVFAVGLLSFENLAQRLDRELKVKLGVQAVTVIRREQGAIPMGTGSAKNSIDQTYVHVGMSAGSARPSSGYTFCRIQRWAQACRDALLADGTPIGPLPDTKSVHFMDSVFLKVLKRHPHLAPDLFVRMFRDVPPSRLHRFLGDSPTFLDCLSLVAALPKVPFLRELCRPVRKESPASSEVTCYP